MLPDPCFLPLPETGGEEGVTDMPKFPTEPVSESRPSAGTMSYGLGALARQNGYIIPVVNKDSKKPRIVESGSEVENRSLLSYDGF